MSRIDAAYDDAINQPSNRGNKTRLNAEFVREGALGYMNHEQFYRKVSWPMFTYVVMILTLFTESGTLGVYARYIREQPATIRCRRRRA